MDFRICLFASRTRKVHAAQVRRFLTSYQLLVAHNAAFDFRIRQSRVDIGTPAHAHPADLLHHERIPGTRHRRQRFSERRLQPNQACSFRRDAWGDGGCLAFDADYLWLHGCPHQRRLPNSIPQTPSNFRDCEIRQRFASRRMPTWVVDREGRRGKYMISVVASSKSRQEQAGGQAAATSAARAATLVILCRSGTRSLQWRQPQ